MSTFWGEHVSLLAQFRLLSALPFLALIALCVWRRVWRLSVRFVAVVVLLGLSGGASAWHDTREPIEGECSGNAVLRTDPKWVGHGTGVVLELHKVRYMAIVHGIAGRRLSTRLAGERVFVTAQCSQNDGMFARSQAVNHVLGRMNVLSVAEEYSEGAGVVRAANRMRRAITSGVAGMNDELESLFAGLVMGDDRNQPREMLTNFRGSGLSHLCAVSGQNVAYLLAAMSPILRRMSRWWRWGLIMGLLGWFVLLTRGEPSVLRAAFMASLVATNALLTLSLNARTVLAGTVIALLIIDPMLAWSVGFALSVGATAGLAWLSSSLSRIVTGRGVLAATLAAQAGTFPISILVFGFVPVISLIANPLVIAIAGGVMMFGLPLALIAYAIPTLSPLISGVLTVPVWWVNFVATWASRISPHGLLNWAIWGGVLWFLHRQHQRNATRHTDVAG